MQIYFIMLIFLSNIITQIFFGGCFRNLLMIIAMVLIHISLMILFLETFKKETFGMFSLQQPL